jgi:hypothetical protein
MQTKGFSFLPEEQVGQHPKIADQRHDKNFITDCISALEEKYFIQRHNRQQPTILRSLNPGHAHDVAMHRQNI